MPDLRFNLETAIEALRREHENLREMLAGRAADYEAELRAVAAALQRDDVVGGIDKGCAVHVIEIDTRAGISFPSGAEVVLAVFGQHLGSSRMAAPLKRGRYRVLVQFLEVQTCTRCGMAGHEASGPGEAAGDNCRKAIGQG